MILPMGTIEFEKTDIREIDLKSLREQISYVPQDVFLFSDSVANNISFGMKDGNSSASGKSGHAGKCS